MSGALQSYDTSILSNGTHPEISLGSLASGFSTPARPSLRVPSATSETTAPSTAPVSTPSPPSGTAFSRRKGGEAASFSRRLSGLNHEEPVDEEVDVLGTPGAERSRWGDGLETPAASRPKRTKSGTSGGKGVTLTLRDQEKVSYPLYLVYFDTKFTISCSTSIISRKRTSISNYAYIFLKNASLSWLPTKWTPR